MLLVHPPGRPQTHLEGHAARIDECRHALARRELAALAVSLPGLGAAALAQHLLLRRQLGEAAAPVSVAAGEAVVAGETALENGQGGSFDRGDRGRARFYRRRRYNRGVRIRLLAFASAADALGGGEQECDLADGSTVGALRGHLATRHPALVPLLPRLAVAVDGEVVSDEVVLPDGAEVALLPPVSGGSGPPVRLCDEPLDLATIAAAVAGPDCGALVLFVGTVRDSHAGRGVERLTYSAYRPMAERRLATLAAEVERTHGARLAIAHRLGTLAPGETSVVIAAAAPHREAAFGASRECLERLKREVPVWKREHYADGSASWREEEPLHREPAPADPLAV